MDESARYELDRLATWLFRVRPRLFPRAPFRIWRLGLDPAVLNPARVAAAPRAQTCRKFSNPRALPEPFMVSRRSSHPWER